VALLDGRSVSKNCFTCIFCLYYTEFTMTKGKLWPVLAIAAIAGTALYFILLYGGPASTRLETATPETSHGKALLSLEDFEYVQTKDGENEWRLIAKQAAYFKSKDITTFKQVQFIYYLQNQQELHLTGETGEMNVKDRSVSVYGDVNVDLGDRVRLETDQIFYNDTSKEIWTPREVRIRSQRCLLKGKGMRAHVDQRKFLLEENVEAKIFPQDVR